MNDFWINEENKHILKEFLENKTLNYTDDTEICGLHGKGERWGIYLAVYENTLQWTLTEHLDEENWDDVWDEDWGGDSENYTFAELTNGRLHEICLQKMASLYLTYQHHPESELTLKDGSTIYIENFSMTKDRAEIYDTNKRYLSYYDLSDKSRKDYDEYVKDLADCDCYELFELFCDSYDYNESAQQIMLTYCDELQLGYEQEVVAEEIKEIKNDVENMTDEELCNKYDINKIGKIYFRGNW